MPAKKPAKKTKATQVSKTKTNPWKVAGIVFASIAVVLVANALIFTRVWKVMPFEGARMTAYLKDKYGQDFVVSNVRLEGAGIGVPGEIEADAYPKSDPTLKFAIGKREDNWATSKYDKDSFLRELWTRQARTEVDKFVKEQLPGVDSYNVDVHFSPGSKATYDAIKGTTPSFTELVQKNINGFGLVVSIRASGSVKPNEPSEEQLDKAFKLVNFVKQTGTVDPTIYYAYRDTNFHEKYASTGTQAYQFKFTIKRGDIEKIHAPNDLIKHFGSVN